ncbi:hypothetical protein B0H11DRAFT_1769461, partial [Mycena galericulata]
ASFSRDEAVDIAKRFGGSVVGQPSSKTNYVVLGDDAGPSKLNAIKKHGLVARSRASAVRACTRIHARMPDVHGDPAALRFRASSRRSRARSVRTVCTYCPSGRRVHIHIHLHIHASIHALAPSLIVRALQILYVGGSTPTPLFSPPSSSAVSSRCPPHLRPPARCAPGAETLAHDEEQTSSAA